MVFLTILRARASTSDRGICGIFAGKYFFTAMRTVAVGCRSRKSREKSNKPPRLESPSIGTETESIQAGRYEISIADASTLRKCYPLLEFGPDFEMKSEFHVTLLFITRGLSRFLSGGSTHFESPYSLNDYHTAIDTYKSLIDQPVRIRPVFIAKNDRVSAIRVKILNRRVRYFDVVPHISIGKKQDANFRESNSLVETVDKLKSSNRHVVDQSVKWSKITDSQDIFGMICFKKHGS
jgi:hypothetical protein